MLLAKKLYNHTSFLNKKSYSEIRKTKMILSLFSCFPTFRDIWKVYNIEKKHNSLSVHLHLYVIFHSIFCTRTKFLWIELFFTYPEKNCHNIEMLYIFFFIFSFSLITKYMCSKYMYSTEYFRRCMKKGKKIKRKKEKDETKRDDVLYMFILVICSHFEEPMILRAVSKCLQVGQE